MSYRVLVCDPDSSFFTKIQDSLLAKGIQFRDTKSCEQAYDFCLEEAPDVVLTGLASPKPKTMNGIDLCHELKNHYPFLPVLIIADKEDHDSILFALRAGAHDYLEKPLHPDEVFRKIASAAEKHHIAHERFRQVSELKAANHQLLQNLAQEYSRAIQAEERLVGFEKRATPKTLLSTELFLGPQTVELKDELISIAQSSARCILLMGEKGSGRRTIASYIHQMSSRENSPFLSVNCFHPNAIELEREFLGYERGAFSSALETRAGLLEMSQGGTVLLRNIHQLPTALQNHLVKFLSTHSLQRLGGTTDCTCDVRIIASTDQDLSALIEKGQFSEELYQLLQVIQFEIPALRMRGSDIISLAHSVLSRLKPEEKIELAADVEHALMTYPWTGNLRELNSVLERIVLLHHSSTIQLSHLPESMKAYAQNSNLALLKKKTGPAFGKFNEVKEEFVRSFEEDYLLKLLNKHEGNITACAKEAGIDRSNFLRLIRKYNLRSTPFRRTG